MENTNALLPSEDLVLQQLLQLQFWNRKHPVAEPEGEAADEKSARPKVLPKQWELTRGVELHSWQQECIESWFAAGRRGVIKVVTGAGKTMLALAIAERLQRDHVPGLRVAIVVPTLVLLHQWREELLVRSNLPASAIGLVGGGEDAEFTDETRIIITVLNSAVKKLPDLVKQAAVDPSLLLIVDECHRAGAGEMQKVFRTARTYTLGLSATPERDNDPTDDEGTDQDAAGPIAFDETVLGRELGPVIFELNYADAIRLGVLPPFSIVHYGLTLKPLEAVQYEKISREIKNLRSELERPGRQGLALIRWCRSKAGAGNPSAGRLISLSAERKRVLFKMEDRGNAVLRILRDAFAENGETKAILFHESIDEVMRLFMLLREHGFAVVAEHSDFPEPMRATSLRLFREGTARVIVSAKSLIEGFNVPSADLGIIIAASSSVRQRVQTLGRLLRKSKAKDGSDKQAVLHVLYGSKTVDELIYEKADWEQFVGAELNRYYLWPDVEHGLPQLVAKAPRSPAKDEAAVDSSTLVPRDTYPGDIDQGLAFTRDSQGTARTDEGELIEPHPELFAILKHSLKVAGRFRVTPVRQFVIELEKLEAGWRGVYLGTLSTPVVLASHSGEALPEREWKPGDSYPLSRATGKTVSVLQRDDRLLATKIRRDVFFVPPLHHIADPDKRKAIAGIQTFLKTAYTKGHRISKVAVTEEGHVVYVWENQAYFVGHAPEGAEGFVFEGS